MLTLVYCKSIFEIRFKDNTIRHHKLHLKQCTCPSIFPLIITAVSLHPCQRRGDEMQASIKSNAQELSTLQKIMETISYHYTILV